MTIGDKLKEAAFVGVLLAISASPILVEYCTKDIKIDYRKKLVCSGSKTKLLYAANRRVEMR